MATSRVKGENEPVLDLDLPAEMNKNDDGVKVRKRKTETSPDFNCNEVLRKSLSRLLPRIQPHADPLQFAYKRDRGTDDATLTLLRHAFTHLDHKGSFVRILFIDFSSAFNTIQPHISAHKLTQVWVNAKLVLWVVNFLVERTQKVRFRNSVSSSMTTTSGSPQGTLLSPFLFTLYTTDCRGTNEAAPIKYSDDSAILDVPNDDNHYFTEVSKFTEWYEMNYLMSNVSKTKELVIRNQDICLIWLSREKRLNV